MEVAWSMRRRASSLMNEHQLLGAPRLPPASPMRAPAQTFTNGLRAVLESRVMFEARFQSYWGDVDAAGIVFFPHIFRFAEQAEEELFLAAGEDRQRMLTENHVWMPRVEAFAKFSKPIRSGAAIRVRLTPQIQGQKTVRYDFVILDDQASESFADGYITVVCVDATHFKSTPIPDPIRKVIEKS